ncbi:M23 family metallopeptidase [Acaryochloris sp. IP29b_bin.148]|uniref:M23 family metallopeptidase n=1 Tax=Acaryochloris sp. IP29b_bin.148 TaxID=2969218 RepID=UPI002616BCE2|nr:M23 family metallopeptidase [Acaryochloris sp. IP29b_bin.148]
MKIKPTILVSILIVELGIILTCQSIAFIFNWHRWHHITYSQSKLDLNDSPISTTTQLAYTLIGPYGYGLNDLKSVYSIPTLKSEVTKNIGGITSLKVSSISQTLLSSTFPLPRQVTINSPLQGFCHPLNGKGWLSQGIRGTTHQGRMEFAYDLAIAVGAPVYAMRSGKVLAIRDRYPDTGGGKEKATQFNYVWIEHDGGYKSIYVHLQQGFRDYVNLKAGDWVNAGQLIGFSGNSGWSSNPHLHIEVQRPSNKQHFTQTVPFVVSGICREQFAGFRNQRLWFTLPQRNKQSISNDLRPTSSQVGQTFLFKIAKIK